LSYCLTFLAAYLLGSFPTGYLVGRAKGVDIRTVGSRNMGATNVFRTVGKLLGIFVLLADALKGWLAVAAVAPLLWSGFSHDALPVGLRVVAGVGAILGHNYTCWLKFKGGKGIATSAGLGGFDGGGGGAAGGGVVHHARAGADGGGRGAGGAGHLQTQKEHRAAAGGDGKPDYLRQKGGGGAMKITVLGAGAWGTALARLLQTGGAEVALWGHDPAHLEEMRRTGRNERYLPGIELPRDWRLEADLARAISGAEWVVAAVPSKAFRAVTQSLREFGGGIVSVTKGIEYQTGLTMCGVLAETAPRARRAALSGPSFALEVARGIPTAIVAASADPATAQAVQKLFHRPNFRVYTSPDLLGVELGGALKNVIAIAAGICDGLGFGDNTKAAFVTRSLAEMRRLGVAGGAQADTFNGLSGLGDLMVTCFSKLSRNRGFGERVGRGEPLPEIIAGMKAVAEGYPTARSAFELARKLNVESPIVDEIHATLYQGKNPALALRDLTARVSKPEN
jgi:glycerol-3-phosphate dehydrogenase (NAD(P)+)